MDLLIISLCVACYLVIGFGFAVGFSVYEKMTYEDPDGGNPAMILFWPLVAIFGSIFGLGLLLTKAVDRTTNKVSDGIIARRRRLKEREASLEEAERLCKERMEHVDALLKEYHNLRTKGTSSNDSECEIQQGNNRTIEAS